MPARSSASQLVAECSNLSIFSGDGVPALVRFFVLAFDFVLLSELGPGLGHFDQQCLVGFVRGFAGQAQAFGRAPLVVVEFGHGTLPLRGNAEDCCSVPCICECGQVGPCLPTLLVKIALNAYPYRVPAGLRRQHMLSGACRWNTLLGLAFVIAMIAVAPPAISRTVAAPATERILDDSGGRITDYLFGRARTGGNVSELSLEAAGLSIALWPRRTLRR